MKGPAESGKICSVGVEIVVVAGCSTGRSAEPFRQLRRDDAAGAGARIGIKSGCRLTAIRACIQLGGVCQRTEQNQKRNSVL